MTLARYARISVWDFLLNLAASLGLTYTVLNVFFVAPSIQYSVIPAVVCLIALIALFAVAFNRRTLTPGIIIYAAACIVALVVAYLISPQPTLLDETEDCYLYFMLVALIVPTLCFLLSRRRGGTAFLFIFGTFICALTQFFYEQGELGWLIVFVIASIGLIIYKNFQISVQTATSVRSFSFPAGFVTALISVGLALLLGCGVWFFIVAPLEPDRLEIKLITEYLALETEFQKGVSSIYQTPNTDLSSDDTSQPGERTVDDLWEQEDGTEVPGSPYGVVYDNSNSSSGSYLGINTDSPEDLFDFLDEPKTDWRFLWLLLLLIPLGIAGYFIGRRIRRNMRLDHIREHSPSVQIAELYHFLMDRFGRVGLGIAGGMTSLEYARNSEQIMRTYNQDMPSTFNELTKTYNAHVYGGEVVTQEEADSFAYYYQHFWKAARKQLGVIRYFFRSFRL